MLVVQREKRKPSLTGTRLCTYLHRSWHCLELRLGCTSCWGHRAAAGAFCLSSSPCCAHYSSDHPAAGVCTYTYGLACPRMKFLLYLVLVCSAITFTYICIPPVWSLRQILWVKRLNRETFFLAEIDIGLSPHCCIFLSRFAPLCGCYSLAHTLARFGKQTWSELFLLGLNFCL